MSTVKVQGNASGSGSITLASPNTNSNQTATLPDRTGNIAMDGPAFSAYQSSSQSLTGTVWTKLQLQTEEFDTNSNFDNVTNYRFTPTVAGYYQVNGRLQLQTFVTQVAVDIYKNGSSYKNLQNTSVTTSVFMAGGSALIYLNGSTDYIELYGYSSSTANTANNQTTTYFQASMVRAA